MLVETEPLTDSRGAFSRLFCAKALNDVLGQRCIVQINHSRTNAIGTVRGLHFQHPPYAEMKFVHCLKGKVWDVVVDLRADSPTLLKWHAEELSSRNGRMLVIPEGCAHGFQVLEENSELLYLHTAFFTPASEGGIRPTDATIDILWPLPVGDISYRDRIHPLLTPEFSGLVA